MKSKKNVTEVKAVKAELKGNFTFPMISKRDIDETLIKHGLTCSFAFLDECRWELRGVHTTDDVVQDVIEDLKRIYSDVEYQALAGVCTPDMLIITW